jgi:hypothetical protein
MKLNVANIYSRAKHGLFIIGNTNIAERVPMWSKVIDMLRTSNSVGTTLILRCPRHPNVRMEVSQPEVGQCVLCYILDRCLIILGF